MIKFGFLSKLVLQLDRSYYIYVTRDIKGIGRPYPHSFCKVFERESKINGLDEGRGSQHLQEYIQEY